MRVPLPDGSIRELPDGSTGADLAADIGPGLARAAMAIRALDGDRTEKRDVVAQQLQRIAVAGLGGDDLDRLSVDQRQGQIPDPAVVVGGAVALLDFLAIQDTNGQRRTGQAGADIGGEVGSGGTVGKLTDRAIGKGDAHGQ